MYLSLKSPKSPEHMALKKMIYEKISNAVYRSGFATSQRAYDDANRDLIEGLDAIEATLADRGPFIRGDIITDCDLLLLPTVLRFDKAYATLFRAGGGSVRILCKRESASDYPHIAEWAKRLWFLGLRGHRNAAIDKKHQMQNTIDIAAAVQSYHRSLYMLCPSGIITGGIQTREQVEADLGLDVPSSQCESWLNKPHLPVSSSVSPTSSIARGTCTK